jgi:hypothetical protein
MKLAGLYLMIVCAAALAQAGDVPLTDNTIVVGERVGPIEKGMTLFGLKSMFGAGKVKPAKLPGAEGAEIDGARMFAGTDREIEIIFNPEGSEKEIFDIRIVGKGWKFSNGLKRTMTIAELEKVNGKPFQVMGFGWDYGGFANFEGGKLAGKISVRFDPGDKEVPDSLSGDRQIPSTDKKLRALDPKIGEISVFMR